MMTARTAQIPKYDQIMYISPIKINIKLKVKSCLKLSLNAFDLIDHHQSEEVFKYCQLHNTCSHGEQGEVQ